MNSYPQPGMKLSHKDRVWGFRISMTFVGKQGGVILFCRPREVSQQGCRVRDRAMLIGAPSRQPETTRLDVFVRHCSSGGLCLTATHPRHRVISTFEGFPESAQSSTAGGVLPHHQSKRNALVK